MTNTVETPSNHALTILYTIGWIGLLGGGLAIVIGFGGGSDYTTGELKNALALQLGTWTVAIGAAAMLLALTAAAIVDGRR
jgi:hypothetical protein